MALWKMDVATTGLRPAHGKQIESILQLFGNITCKIYSETTEAWHRGPICAGNDLSFYFTA